MKPSWDSCGSDEMVTGDREGEASSVVDSDVGTY